MKSHLLTYAVALPVIFAMAGPASALTIRLTDLDTANVITVNDNQAADDLDGTVGELLYDSNTAATTLGGVFSLIEVSATTKPVIGLPNRAELALEVEADSDFLAGNLLIEVTETGFTLDDSVAWNALHALGGFTAGTVDIQAWWDAGNTAFGKTNVIGPNFNFASTIDPFEGFSDTIFDVETGSSPFSMTTAIRISHATGDELTEATSGVAMSPVPVPASLPLLAAALGIGALISRRRRRG